MRYASFHPDCSKSFVEAALIKTFQTLQKLGSCQLYQMDMLSLLTAFRDFRFMLFLLLWLEDSVGTAYDVTYSKVIDPLPLVQKPGVHTGRTEVEIAVAFGSQFRGCGYPNVEDMCNILDCWTEYTNVGDCHFHPSCQNRFCADYDARVAACT
eukprot:1177395-Prorocentrum_minimum.AAC.3